MANNPIFQRNVPGLTEILARSCVAVAGCGGLGSNAAVALARSGVGHLILADCDRVEASNLNRQYFFQEDIGQFKVEALARHIRRIWPDIRLTLHNLAVTPATVVPLFGAADILIEAFDVAERKHWLIQTWAKNFPKKPIVCGNGLAGLGHSDALRVQKIGNISFCGDGETDMSLGLCSARVAIVANMEAYVAITLLAEKEFL